MQTTASTLTILSWVSNTIVADLYCRLSTNDLKCYNNSNKTKQFQKQNIY